MTIGRSMRGGMLAWLTCLAALASWSLPALSQVRDPTAPPRAPTAVGATARKVAPGVSVTALFLSADGNRAIVNGQVVHPGDVVRGVRIIAIDAGGVRYRRNGAPVYARLAKPALSVKSAVEEKKQ